MNPVLAIAGVELRRFFRDRSNIFFVFIFPLMLILLLGIQFGVGSAGPIVAVAGGEGTPLARDLTDRLKAEGLTVRPDAASAVRRDVSRGSTDVGLFISEQAGKAYDDAGPVELEVLAAPDASGQTALQALRATVRDLGRTQLQLRALMDGGVTEDAARSALARAKTSAVEPTVQVMESGGVSSEFRGLGRFDLGAAQQLLLFVFLSSLTGAAALIQARRYGVISRALAAPVTAARTMTGLALGRFAIAGVQGVYILLGTALLFGVDWGNLWLAMLVVGVFSLVAAAAAMVVGSMLDHDGAATGVGIGLGLVVAGLGGCMVPPEFFSEPMAAVSRFTPHRWAYDAIAEVQRHEAALQDILPHLGVLAAMAAGLLVLGTWLLRRSLARAL
ncbi:MULTISPECIES: ABC transporter permease [Paenarthrobacter]|uniref:ABC transporter permease n=1 Tax=Paenarthrobacter TaxID=1742992 RepID=UPI00074D380A|nr:ABC transporter permease [Paenarthrobacter ureafaciens]AMB40388.1 multidrug ABC transporter permease [Arthrobacter sp. ATCC 21022]KUR65056.1 multidrug ABC transporter permease [Arthrobacter sp. ATCC 21022]RWW91551.1 ABC transporter permease [Paenarthrobacter ureafaciens]